MKVTLTVTFSAKYVEQARSELRDYGDCEPTDAQVREWLIDAWLAGDKVRCAQFEIE